MWPGPGLVWFYGGIFAATKHCLQHDIIGSQVRRLRALADLSVNNIVKVRKRKETKDNTGSASHLMQVKEKNGWL